MTAPAKRERRPRLETFHTSRDFQQAKKSQTRPQFLQIVAKPKPTAAQVESSRARATREQPQRT